MSGLKSKPSANQIWSYNSLHLMGLAQKSFDRVDDSTSESQIVIILATMALEAFINELQHSAEVLLKLKKSDPVEMVARLLGEGEKEHASPLFKIQIAYAAMTGKPADTGSQPFQDLKLLFQLRNLLVHAKPDPLDMIGGDNPPALPQMVRKFVSRALITQPKGKSRSSWQHYVIVPDVAKWAYNSVVRAQKWLSKAAPSGPLKQMLRVMIADIKEIN